MNIFFYHRLESLNFLDSEDFEFADHLIQDRRNIDSGDFILTEGGTQRRIQFVLDGWAIRHKSSVDGDRQILNFVLPGDVIGLFSPIYKQSEHSVEAITSMTLGSFPADRLLEVFRDVPRLALTLSWVAGQDERILEEQIVRIGRRRATKRMAHLLVELHRRLRRCGYTREDACHLPLNQLLLSDSLGLSHVHAHRVFRELEKDALIKRESGSIILLDLRLLAELADFDAGYLEPGPHGPAVRALNN